MKCTLKLLTVVALWVMFCHSSFAQVRKYSNEFLSIGVGAKALAMGGAQVSSSNDANSMYWNPAGLCGINGGVQVSAMHSEYFTGIAKYDFGAVAIPLSRSDKYSKKSYLGIGLMRFAVDDIPNTLQLIDANGSVNYNNITSFSAADYGFLASYARNIIEPNRRNDDYFRVGGSVKVIHRIVGSFAKAWGFGIDAGVQYRKNNLLLGATLQDATSTFNSWSFTFSNKDQAVLAKTGNIIPTSSTEITAPKIRLGAGYVININDEKFTIQPEAGFDITTDGKRNVLIKTSAISIDPKLGVEAAYNKMVFVRLGLSNIQTQTNDEDKKITTVQPNLGVGLKIKNFYVDYALTSPGSLGSVLYSHVFSLKLDIGSPDN